MRHRMVAIGLILTAGLFAPGQSCITISGNDDDEPSGGEENAVTVRFVNHTARAVDVEFYLTANTVTDIGADLFAPGNKVTAEIGFAGSGLLEAGAADQIVIACDDATALGTTGGLFLNANTGSQLGRGRQLTLFKGLQYGCGDVVTFTYSESGGEFSTGFSVQ